MVWVSSVRMILWSHTSGVWRSSGVTHLVCGDRLTHLVCGDRLTHLVCGDRQESHIWCVEIVSHIWCVEIVSHIWCVEIVRGPQGSSVLLYSAEERAQSPLLPLSATALREHKLPCCQVQWTVDLQQQTWRHTQPLH
ncbi:hypothetical protein R3I94_013922 [Phoxinus phoxinus]